MGFLPVDDQLEIISKGTEEVIPLQDLRHKLESSIKNNKPLVVKLGCDPSRPDLHIGHSVVLQKLRDFQDLGADKQQTSSRQAAKQTSRQADKQTSRHVDKQDKQTSR